MGAVYSTDSAPAREVALRGRVTGLVRALVGDTPVVHFLAAHDLTTKTRPARYDDISAVVPTDLTRPGTEVAADAGPFPAQLDLVASPPMGSRSPPLGWWPSLPGRCSRRRAAPSEAAGHGSNKRRRADAV